jgi:hypothetical protein
MQMNNLLDSGENLDDLWNSLNLSVSKGQPKNANAE